MPGISFIYKSDLLDTSQINDCLADLKHEQNYKVQKIFSNTNFVSVFSGNEEYPKQYFEDSEVAIFVEGLIYNKNDHEIEKLLRNISKSYMADNDFGKLITEFIGDCDGDFIILMWFKKSNEFIIFNDRWGRLPSYYYQSGDMFIFSRELKFILHFIPVIEFDKMAMAEFLTLQYTLGSKTLIKNIHRLSPSSMFHLVSSPGQLRVDHAKLLEVNFEEIQTGMSKDECVERCRELFLHSTNDRLTKLRERKYRITSDLSGGLDSRTVLAGLCKCDAEVDCYTNYRIMRDESEYASKIAAMYNRKLIQVSASNNMNYADMRRITYMTDCTVDVWTALLTYNESLERTKLVQGSSTRFMGFGGEFLRHPYKEPSGYSTLVDTLRDGYFIRCINMEQACSLLGLEHEAFFEQLASYFDNYTEATLRDKVKHLYFEYYNNLVNLGENRHRLHFWTVESLWSKDLLDFATRYIPRSYIGLDFYRRFMRSIDTNLLTIPAYSFGIRLNSRVNLHIAHLLGYAKDWLNTNRHTNTYKHLAKFSFKVYNYIYCLKSKPSPQLRQGLLENYLNLGATCAYLDKSNVVKFIKEEKNKEKLYQLLTLILYFREIESRFAHKIRSQASKC